MNKQKVVCEFYKATMEKIKFDHEELLLKSNNLQDKIVNGVKKWESLEVEFDALNTHW